MKKTLTIFTALALMSFAAERFITIKFSICIRDKLCTEKISLVGYFFPKNSNSNPCTNFKIDKQFDAAISLFHVISYLTDNESLVNCFKLTNQHLKQDGMFLFDIWYSPAVYVQKPETRIKRLENNDIKITRIAESEINYNSNIVDVHFEVNILNKYNNRLEIINEKHPMRHFSILELDLLAQLTGFEIIKAEEFLTYNIPNENI
jgi:hypothetical protein